MHSVADMSLQPFLEVFTASHRTWYANLIPGITHTRGTLSIAFLLSTSLEDPFRSGAYDNTELAFQCKPFAGQPLHTFTSGSWVGLMQSADYCSPLTKPAATLHLPQHDLSQWLVRCLIAFSILFSILAPCITIDVSLKGLFLWPLHFWSNQRVPLRSTTLS